MDRALLSENVAFCVKTIVIDSHKSIWRRTFWFGYFHDAFSHR